MLIFYHCDTTDAIIILGSYFSGIQSELIVQSHFGKHCKTIGFSTLVRGKRRLFLFVVSILLIHKRLSPESLPKFSLVALPKLPVYVEPESSPFCRSNQMPRLTRRGPGSHFIKKIIVPVGVAGRMEMTRQVGCCGRIAFCSQKQVLPSSVLGYVERM